jgi:hypothetical protein
MPIVGTEQSSLMAAARSSGMCSNAQAKAPAVSSSRAIVSVLLGRLRIVALLDVAGPVDAPGRQADVGHHRDAHVGEALGRFEGVWAAVYLDRVRVGHRAHPAAVLDAPGEIVAEGADGHLGPDDRLVGTAADRRRPGDGPSRVTGSVVTWPYRVLPTLSPTRSTSTPGRPRGRATP